MKPVVSKKEAAEIIRTERFRAGVSWDDIAVRIGEDPAWNVGDMLSLDPDVVEALQMQPYRGSFEEQVPSDPTLYRFYEALNVYGPAIKELIHEEFGDGIMSAINFKMDVQRRKDAGGDRVVVIVDGKFFDYNW